MLSDRLYYELENIQARRRQGLQLRIPRVQRIAGDIYINDFDLNRIQKCRFCSQKSRQMLSPPSPSQQLKVSKTKQHKRYKTMTTNQDSQTNFKSNSSHFDSLPIVPLKLKKPFVEIDILIIQTYYVAHNISAKPPAKQTIKKIPKLPSRDSVATFIQNYRSLDSRFDVDTLTRCETFKVVYEQKEYLYFGEWAHDQKRGKGVMVTDKWVFEGIWTNNQRQQGIQITNKGIYKGRFTNNKRGKTGEFMWNNGQHYSGQWLKGLKHGSGVWKATNGDIYMGEWKQGRVQGKGVHISSNGQKYEGDFVNFLKEGEGKEWFPNGDYYQGEFLRGKPHGKGIYKWKKGITYKGEFQDGQRSGKGIISRQGASYQGYFLREKAHGQGKLLIAGGITYQGGFRQGKRYGRGVLKQRHRVFVGQWKNDQFLQRLKE